ncbi:MAG: monovalent cation/hydrogen antiporter [Pseudonocardiales bacterium]|jgi:CPA1 family monovalent cation:H+ antiporter|nr:monovalent cation/hydrogen antiporter [Pseudonocardiales bacterium]
MPTDVLLVVLLTTVTVSPWFARLTRLPLPTAQFLLGCVLAALPAAGQLHVSPNLILLVVLPMLLFWEGYRTSVAWVRRYWRPILLNGVFLVGVTAALIAVVAHWFDFPWPAAWSLGAALAPTDASAVTAFGRALPTSLVTVLRAESLINDGTALVILAVAIQAADHHQFGPGAITLRAVESYGVGIAVGLAVTVLLLVAVRRIAEPLVNASFAISLPFLAAVPAEALHGSGVVAVVTCALVGSRSARRLVPGRARQPIHAFWEITTFVLGGALFVLTGVQVRGLVTGISASHAASLVAQGLLITLLALVVRFCWVNLWTVILRTVDRRPVQRALRAPFRARAVNAWAGLRGGISLAAALTVPSVAAGLPFPHRTDLLVITFVVVAASLLLQGSTLGRVIRWASPSLPAADATAVARARRQLAERIRRALDDGDLLSDASAEVRDQLRRHVSVDVDGSADQQRQVDEMRANLRVLERKREELVAMAVAGEVEDTVMWQVQRLLDNEETRLEALLSATGSAELENDDVNVGHGAGRS